ncbi:radical SAM protein [Candidatus Woesearchaeota archaeon]|jgi:radical SAM protein with 4Fe4S-binding SPASM domain|nr:radical SAM protein [Candidatus Woesearchaeota archaeon]MBT6519863.1 radical SAM protein [Candidatus Woesearchaeota archaeon]MBT7367155.1 radical SAM protein [Candidatus Woesearchaeota archaeon]
MTKVKLDPKVAVWEYTLKCNSKCIHCGSDAINARANELNTNESLNLVDQIANIGFDLVVLSGGEPTLRKDWFEISKKIKSEEMELGIISNALAWNSDTIDKIASLDAFSIGFSVDGEKELHNYLRGASGSHAKIFSVIKELKKRDTTVCVVTSVNKKNLEELTQIRNRLIVYGVDAWQIQMASPMGRMAENKDIVLDADDYYRLGEFIVETRERLPLMNVQAGDCMGYFGKLESQIRDREWPGCMAGIEGLGIEADGTVKGCLSIRKDYAIEGNVRDTPLKDIWFNPTNFKYTRGFNKSDIKGDCKGCEYDIKCRGGCQSQSTAFFDEFNNAPYCFLRYENEKKS